MYLLEQLQELVKSNVLRYKNIKIFYLVYTYNGKPNDEAEHLIIYNIDEMNDKFFDKFQESLREIARSTEQKVQILPFKEFHFYEAIKKNIADQILYEQYIYTDDILVQTNKYIRKPKVSLYNNTYHISNVGEKNRASGLQVKTLSDALVVVQLYSLGADLDI